MADHKNSGLVGFCIKDVLPAEPLLYLSTGSPVFLQPASFLRCQNIIKYREKVINIKLVGKKKLLYYSQRYTLTWPDSTIIVIWSSHCLSFHRFPSPHPLEGLSQALEAEAEVQPCILASCYFIKISTFYITVTPHSGASIFAQWEFCAWFDLVHLSHLSLLVLLIFPSKFTLI